MPGLPDTTAAAVLADLAAFAAAFAFAFCRGTLACRGGPLGCNRCRNGARSSSPDAVTASDPQRLLDHSSMLNTGLLRLTLASGDRAAAAGSVRMLACLRSLADSKKASGQGLVLRLPERFLAVKRLVPVEKLP